MNEHFKQALDAATPTSDDVRDPLLRPERGEPAPVVDQILKSETQSASVDESQKEKQRKLDALQPLG